MSVVWISFPRLRAGCAIEQPLALSIIAGLLLQFPTVPLAMPVLISLTVRRHHPVTRTPAAGMPQPTPAECALERK
jgi:hypothetical protein